MRNILKVDTPNDYARFVDAPVLHPLISIIHYDELAPFRHSLNNYGVYGLFIQRQFPHNLSYGMRKLQVSDGSIIAVEPGQIGGLEDNGERISLCGWVLLWSPELLNGSELERQIDRYQFFSYFFDGSLRMEPDEWLCITQLVAQMRQELQTHEDSPSLRSVLLAYLRLILEYCNRIYQRQISEEDRGEADLLKRFHNLLRTYFRENRQLMNGLPTVAWCASELAQHQRDIPPARFRLPSPFHASLQAHYRAHSQRVRGEVISQQAQRLFYNSKRARCLSEPCMLIHKLKSNIQMKKITNYKP